MSSMACSTETLVHRRSRLVLLVRARLRLHSSVVIVLLLFLEAPLLLLFFFCVRRCCVEYIVVTIICSSLLRVRFCLCANISTSTSPYRSFVRGGLVRVFCAFFLEWQQKSTAC